MARECSEFGFKYCGVSFDSWKDKRCQFQEAKARYDQFFKADGQKKTGGLAITVRLTRQPGIRLSQQ
ncbi:Tox-REase-5 domain-containing protein [Enterobacteriaceae bacterium ESL0689]|nr:Tox-REase-5 domain-containing protein [Enterobacteriaceae bacterium ESL0689]